LRSPESAPLEAAVERNVRGHQRCVGPLEHEPGLAHPPGCAGKSRSNAGCQPPGVDFRRFQKAVWGLCDVVESEGEVEEGHCGLAQEEEVRVPGVQEGRTQEAPRAFHCAEVPALVLARIRGTRQQREEGAIGQRMSMRGVTECTMGGDSDGF